MRLDHKFVKIIPNDLEEMVLYISVDCRVAIHKCCCGCGNEVVTPFSPENWKLIFDGKTISLHPSIGNFSFKCQSHYWIKNSLVDIESKYKINQTNKRHLNSLSILDWLKKKSKLILGIKNFDTKLRKQKKTRNRHCP